METISEIDNCLKSIQNKIRNLYEESKKNGILLKEKNILIKLEELICQFDIKEPLNLLFWGLTNSGKTTLISSLINNGPININEDESFLPIHFLGETMTFYTIALTDEKIYQYKYTENDELIEGNICNNCKEMKLCLSKFSRNEFCNGELRNDSDLDKFSEEKKPKMELKIYSSNENLIKKKDIIRLIDSPGMTENFAIKCVSEYAKQKTSASVLCIDFATGFLL